MGSAEQQHVQGRSCGTQRLIVWLSNTLEIAQAETRPAATGDESASIHGR